ncbi:MAG: halocyanin domain-containing protein [Haloarculaceae archaeon]
MDENSPLDGPEGNWWDKAVNRRETIWLGISGGWGLTMFAWMMGWLNFGGQNQTGPTHPVDPEQFRKTVQGYKDRAKRATVDGSQAIVPPGSDVYVGAYQWAWDGLPVVLEAGKPYTFHLSSYDVQHGFSVRRESNLSQQISLQVLPDYEWENEMTFDEPGTFQVVCNEYCGAGHSAMHGVFHVVDSYDDLEITEAGAGGSVSSVDDWLSDVGNYDGSVADETGQDAVTIHVGAQGNGGSFAFDPPAVQVSQGTTVTFDWVSNTHDVVVESQPDGADWGGHEPIENTGFSLEHTFETSGLYAYYCKPHRSLGMKGAVEVQ